MKLTEHFTLEEMTFSEYAIRNDITNIADALIIGALRDTCVMILEPLRTAIDRPIKITSGYRNRYLNTAIGGSKVSQHCFGQAVDIKVSDMTIEELFQKIIELDLPYDQVIQEFDSWVHISYRNNPRKEKLRAKRKNGLTIYEKVK